MIWRLRGVLKPPLPPPPRYVSGWHQYSQKLQDEQCEKDKVGVVRLRGMKGWMFVFQFLKLGSSESIGASISENSQFNSSLIAFLVLPQNMRIEKDHQTRVLVPCINTSRGLKSLDCPTFLEQVTITSFNSLVFSNN